MYWKLATLKNWLFQPSDGKSVKLWMSRVKPKCSSPQPLTNCYSQGKGSFEGKSQVERATYNLVDKVE